LVVSTRSCRALSASCRCREGARLEKAQTTFDLPLSALHFDKHYASLYPSAILSYAFTDIRTARISYSRRVTRPYPFQLSPIENKLDARNIFRGNPNLGAEYTDALDVSVSDARTWGSITLNPFFRHTNNAVKNIQFVDANGISVSTYENLARNSTLGTDLSLSYRHGPFTGSGGFGANYYTSDASNLTGTVSSINLSTNAFSWSARANGTWKFTNVWDAQAFANYRAATKTEGGSTLALVNMSLGGRYKIWGDQGNIGIRVSDPFNLSKFGYRAANGQVIEFSQRYFGARAVYLGIMRNFGQALRLKPKSDSDENPTGPPSP
jgi:ferric enterobactin receptor